MSEYNVTFRVVKSGTIKIKGNSYEDAEREAREKIAKHVVKMLKQVDDVQLGQMDVEITSVSPR